MKKLIHDYLSNVYFLHDNCRINKIPYTLSTHATTIIRELSLVFGLNKKQLKWYFKSWVLKQNRNFEFNTFWTPTKVFMTWAPSIELMQDLQAFHGLDAEAELTALLAQEISNEIDREIINILLYQENSLDSDLIITEDYQIV